MLNVIKMTHEQFLQVESLRKLPLFSFLSPEQCQEVASLTHFISRAPNEVLFRQGEIFDSFCILLDGSVKLEINDTSGHVYPLGEVYRGSLIGEIAMLRGVPARVTAACASPCTVAVFGTPALYALLAQMTPEQTLSFFAEVDQQARIASERAFREIMQYRMMASQIEAEKLRALTQMSAGLAHEINTPLAVINTAVNLMARDLATAPPELTAQRAAEIAESLELMRRSVERADHLMHNFKNLSASQLADQKAVCDIVEVIEESIELISVNLKRSKVIVKFEHSLAASGKKWFGYRGLLSQVLINLLTNVERYAYPNGMGGTAKVALSLDKDEHYILTVSDSGKGIAVEDQPHIFEPFFTTGKSIGGTGLGLSIVKNIVANDLRGKITVQSHPQQGTTFTITFPKSVD